MALEASRRVEAEVGSWDGVTVHPHRFGGIEFRLGRRELGHLHSDRLADLPFRRPVRNMLVETGRAQPHHVLPDSGWVSRPIRTPEDVEETIELFRLSYERASVARAGPSARGRNRESPHRLRARRDGENTSNAQSSIYVMNADGSGLRKLS